VGGKGQEGERELYFEFAAESLCSAACRASSIVSLCRDLLLLRCLSSLLKGGSKERGEFRNAAAPSSQPTHEPAKSGRESGQMKKRIVSCIVCTNDLARWGTSALPRKGLGVISSRVYQHLNSGRGMACRR
jgi:hypothetical protein